YTDFEGWKSDHNVLFLCTDFTTGAEHDREIAEGRFFPLNALPADLIAGHRRRLEEYQAGLSHPQFGKW
ncbi:MAG TPA: hypothetical protein VLZ89_17595, partial [Anaerolineales bacterium]|nr:hypothetical protein [Anaerolineales bacterium]